MEIAVFSDVTQFSLIDVTDVSEGLAGSIFTMEE
jgi:hypothetical protein